MSEPKKTPFKPKWPVALSPEEEAAMDNFQGNGSLPTEPPRIDTRIIPREKEYSLSLRSLSEIAALTQKLADYAGYDVYHGPNPDFADLRSLSRELTHFTALTSDPFAPGSFVIPATLQADPLTVDQPEPGLSPRIIPTDEVANRFGEILTLLDSKNSPTEVSIGALQTLEALAPILKREASAIEFHTADSFRKPLVTFPIGENFIGKVRHVIDRRRPTQDKPESLVGRVTALDIVDGKLLLSVKKFRRRVKGTFLPFFSPSLLESLNRHVKLTGSIEWKGDFPAVIHIHSVELIDVDQP